MSKPKSFFRVFTESGPLIALAVAVALLVGIVGPASAQFFNFGGPQRPQPRSGGVGGGVCGGRGRWGGARLPPLPPRAPPPGRPAFSPGPPPPEPAPPPRPRPLVPPPPHPLSRPPP